MPDTDAPDRPLLVLIAGPYLSGTDGDPTKIAANRARLEAAALPIYERGHLPLLGEWLALPIIHAAGGREPGDAVFIPSLWWHHMEGLEAFNVLVNSWWRPVPAWMDSPMNALMLERGFVKWQLPERYEVIDAIPRTSTGKFWKLKLREMFPR